eukprot:scaffold106236_cov48-Phaeocystis_antarctica.AAC.1
MVYSPVLTPLYARLIVPSREETGFSSKRERRSSAPSRQGSQGSTAVPALGFAPVDPPAHRRHRTAQGDRSGT